MIKQKTIIQVWGQQGCGKSTTIKLIKEELEKRYVNSNHTYSITTIPNGDINHLGTYNSNLIGIESMGDYLDVNLELRLDDYVLNQKCDIIICACRMYNDVATYVKDLASTNQYRLIKTTNYRAPDESKNTQDDLNIFSAIQIVELINQLMSGNI